MYTLVVWTLERCTNTHTHTGRSGAGSRRKNNCIHTWWKWGSCKRRDLRESYSEEQRDALSSSNGRPYLGALFLPLKRYTR